MENLDLHGARAALRGNPSFVWRAGQDRRLNLIGEHGLPGGQPVERILVDGCGVGMYVRALRPYAQQVAGIDIEMEHLAIARANAADANAADAAIAQALCERLPYADDTFDLVLSHEVLEHVTDDRLAAAEMVRVLKPGGRAVIFVPNRLYPFETHGHYWRGVYHFGNTPLINYLPDPLRNRLAPHVRAYTAGGLLDLFVGQPVRVAAFTQIFPGYDNIVARRPAVGRWLRRVTYALEQTPLTRLALSHFLVVTKE
jgi:SAM-dependent methyltransferase